MGNFKDLRVWKEGVQLATEIYAITKIAPFVKDYGLSNQIQRAGVSISSNIAEGNQRGSDRESVRFFNIARASAAEVITQLPIAHNIGYIDKETLLRLEAKTEKIRAGLWGLIKVRGGNKPLNMIFWPIITLFFPII